MKKNYMKKTLAVALTAAVLAPASFVEAAQFKDVSANHWAYQFIEDMSDQGVIKGYVDKTYKPEKEVQFLEVLNLIKGVINPSADDLANAREKYGADVKDLEVPEWAEDAVLTALEKDVLSLDKLKEAKDAGMVSYQPTRIPDRSSVAVYYARALNLDKKEDTGNLKYEDMDKINKDVKEYLAALVDAGIFEATGADGNFQGDRGIRRDEMAKITYLSRKYMKNEDKKEESFVYGRVSKLKDRTLTLSATTNKGDVDFQKGTVKNGILQEFEIPKDAKLLAHAVDIEPEDIQPDSLVELKMVKGEIKEVKLWLKEGGVEGTVTKLEDTNSGGKKVTIKLVNDEEESFYLPKGSFKVPDRGKWVIYGLDYGTISREYENEKGTLAMYTGLVTGYKDSDYNPGVKQIDFQLIDGSIYHLEVKKDAKWSLLDDFSDYSSKKEPFPDKEKAVGSYAQVYLEEGRVHSVEVINQKIRLLDDVLTIDSLEKGPIEDGPITIEVREGKNGEKAKFSLETDRLDAMPVVGKQYKVLALINKDNHLFEIQQFDLVNEK